MNVCCGYGHIVIYVVYVQLNTANGGVFPEASTRALKLPFDIWSTILVMLTDRCLIISSNCDHCSLLHPNRFFVLQQCKLCIWLPSQTWRAMEMSFHTWSHLSFIWSEPNFNAFVHLYNCIWMSITFVLVVGNNAYNNNDIHYITQVYRWTMFMSVL
ncbi:hypothetical protein BLOT_005881 [Blomia tropicalis]|nr:hypothetical protein BLOT_005881 [Blomia tropicalis]